MLIMLFLACTNQKPNYETFEVNDPESNDELSDTDLQSGTYAYKISTAEQLQDPSPLGNGAWEVSQTVMIQWMHFERDGDEIEFKVETCSMDITESFGTQTSLPQTFFDVTAGRSREGTLSSQNVGAEVEIFRYYDLNGLHMDNPAEESIPSHGNDSRIYDQDHDGNPGFTANLAMGPLEAEIYSAQKIEQELTGIVINPERIEGNVWSRNHQFTIDASMSVFAVDLGRKPEDDHELNWFIIQKVDDGYDCADIMENAKDIFDY